MISDESVELEASLSRNGERFRRLPVRRGRMPPAGSGTASPGNTGGVKATRTSWVAFFLLAAAGVSCAQADETARYIEARDRTIQELKGVDEFDRAKFSALQTQLRELLGPFHREGFTGEGELNLHNLTDGLGFGRLDGLEYASRDERTAVLVTTQPLVTDWLPKFYEESDGNTLSSLLSREPDKLLTWAWGIEDKHFTLVRRLSVKKPKGMTTAMAFLGNLTADDGNYIPGSIIATIVRADRVYFVSQKLTTPLPVFEECDRRWQTLWDSGRADKDDAAFAAFNECYVARVVSTPAFQAARKQAQELIETFAR